jgi:hypothetical protein
MYYCHSLVFVISLLFGCAVGFSPVWLRSATTRHSIALGKQNNTAAYHAIIAERAFSTLQKPKKL